MKVTEQRLTARDGVSLHLRTWEPEGTPRAVLQIVHGMAEHAARYAPLAGSLVGAGYASFALDLRGHGKTAASPEAYGFFSREAGWRRVLDDLAQVQQLIGARFPGTPRVLLGHSMGSFLAQSYVLRYPSTVDALVLSGTNAGGGLLVEVGRMVARLERRRLGAEGRSALLELLSFGTYNKRFRPQRTEADWLSRDPAQVDAYIRDPLCGFRATNQLWVDMTDALSALGRARWQDLPRALPIYVFSGSEDPVGLRTKRVSRLLRTLGKHGFENVSYRFYPGARHECLNELNREEVERDLIDWLGRNVPRQRTILHD